MAPRVLNQAWSKGL